MIKLVAKEGDSKTIWACVHRWVQLTGQKNNLIDLELDITATHLNGCPLEPSPKP